MADVTFPSVPKVVSLLRYDGPGRTGDILPPLAGYPVVCVTVRHPLPRQRCSNVDLGREGEGQKLHKQRI